jgi:hypothetical protein
MEQVTSTGVPGVTVTWLGLHVALIWLAAGAAALAPMVVELTVVHNLSFGHSPFLLAAQLWTVRVMEPDAPGGTVLVGLNERLTSGAFVICDADVV